MTGLTTAELAYIRDAIEELLPDTATILTVTNVANTLGGYAENIGTAGTSACRIDPLNQITKTMEQVNSGAIRPFHTFMLTLPYDTTITTENMVRVNDITYNVTSVDIGKSWQASVRAFLERA